jgi:tetratricopeptide (TPR) repeat protein
LAVRFAHDQGVAARHYLAFAKWLIGDMDGASRLIGEAKSPAERVGHPPTSVAAYAIAAWLDCVRGDHSQARANAESAIGLARDFDLPLWRWTAGFCLSWARAASEGTRSAWDEAEAALNALSAHGPGLSEFSAAYVAPGFAQLGDFDRALALADRALSGPADKGLRVFLPEAHRDPRDPAPAEEAFRTAIAIAREQGSRAFELRAALALAKLCQSAARPAEPTPCRRRRSKAFRRRRKCPRSPRRRR